MAQWHSERLSALDATFLAIEDHNAHMHIGSVAIFDSERVLRPEGGLDFDRLVDFVDAQLERIPRFRQKLATVPRLGNPVWVDDDQFNLLYHVRHTALPFPGDERRLKRLAGRVMSQQLDRGKPLWELWFVEGLERDRFAVISKLHHCLADGISGADLLGALMGPDPDYEPKAPKPFNPRPAPPAASLVAEEIAHRASLPLSAARGAGEALFHVGRSLGSLRETLGAVGETAAAGMSAASPTPLNQPIGPHRRFDWIRLDFDAVHRVGRALRGTANDAVLAVVAGAVRDFLFKRGIPAEELDFRAMVPVSLRERDERGSVGNRVSSLLVQLPLDEADPRRRLKRVIEATRRAKGSGQRRGGEALAQLAEASSVLMAGFARMASRSQAANLVVTNVPGPRVPVYMLGAPLREVYPMVPLAPTQALGIALFSYAGGLFWGFNSDWDKVRDLHDFVDAIRAGFEALCDAVPESAAQGPDAPESDERSA